MINLYFNAEKQILTRTDREDLASNSREIHQCNFDLSDDWANMQITAVFKYMGRKWDVLLAADNTCVVPAEVLAGQEGFAVGLYGVREDQVITSTLITVPVSKGANVGGIAPQITPSMYDQIMAKIEDIEEEIEGGTGVTPAITAEATVDNTSGTPAVNVTKSGTDETPQFTFAFSGLKGEKGATPVITANATVDNTTGTPAVNVSKTGTDAAPEFTFAFTGLKGPKGDPGTPGSENAETAKAIKNPIFKENIAHAKTYFVATSFRDWELDRNYIYIVDNIQGLNSGPPVGYMDSSGTWAGYIYMQKSITVNGNTYRYNTGYVPSNAARNTPAYLVGDNANPIDINIWIVDVTGVTVTNELIEAIINNNLENIDYLDLMRLIAPIENVLTNKWLGKNVLFIGDSLTAAQKYQTTVKNNLDINIYNHCKGGMGIIQCVDGENGAPPYDPDNFNAGTLYPLMASDVAGKDLIVFYAGYNNRGTEDGTVGDCYDPNDSTQGRTIAGFMQYALNRIFEELANASNLTCRVLVVTVDCAGKYPYIDADGYEQYPANSGRTMETMANIQKAVAAANNVPCLDLWHDSGINRHTWTVYGANPNAYIENPTDTSTPYPHNGDQLHKSNAGYRLIGDCITGAIIEHWGN